LSLRFFEEVLQMLAYYCARAAGHSPDEGVDLDIFSPSPFPFFPLWLSSPLSVPLLKDDLRRHFSFFLRQTYCTLGSEN